MLEFFAGFIVGRYLKLPSIEFFSDEELIQHEKREWFEKNENYQEYLIEEQKKLKDGDKIGLKNIV